MIDCIIKPEFFASRMTTRKEYKKIARWIRKARRRMNEININTISFNLALLTITIKVLDNG